MFTPKNIQVALEELFDLCDPDYMMDMLENYGEEFDDISPVLLARAFQNSAEMVCEYRVLSIVGEGIDYRGEALLGNRAVKLDIVNIGLHFFLKNVRPYAASCSEA